MKRMKHATHLVTNVMLGHAVLVTLVGIAYWAGVPGFSDGDTESRKATAFFWSFAVLLLVARRGLAADRRWLVPVLAVVGINWLESAYELFLVGNPWFLPPFVIETLGGAFYFAAFVRTAGQPAPRPAPVVAPAQP